MIEAQVAPVLDAASQSAQSAADANAAAQGVVTRANGGEFDGLPGLPGSPTAFELRGTGSPLGVVAAPPGTYYTDTAGTLGAWRWLKKSGTATAGWEVIEGNTGWRNISAMTVPGLFDMRAETIFQVRRREKSVDMIIRAWTGAGSTGITNRAATVIIPELPIEFGPIPDAGGSLALGAVLLGGALELVELTAYGQPAGLCIRGDGNGSWLATTGIRLQAHWDSLTAWPTTLPGTPA